MYKSFNVRTLGILEIGHLKNVFPERGKRSTQVELLIIYLIMNRDRNITASQLITYLWEDKENQVTIGALRNLVYRARKDLKMLYDKEPCILSKGHSYYWNPAVKCVVDYEELLKLAESIIESNETIDLQVKKAWQLADLFENEFLPEFQDNSWIKQKNEVLLKSCYESLISIIDNLKQANEYQIIIDLLQHPNLVKIEDDKLFAARLDAYYQMKQYDVALKYYRNILNKYYLYYGKTVPAAIKQVYQECLNKLPEVEVENIEIEDVLDQSETVTGAFYCDFTVFKRIYQLNLIDVTKLNNEHALVMLTIRNQDEHYDSHKLQNYSQLLKNLMQQNLRKNDIFSQYSLTQYFILIQSPKMTGIETAVNRIIRYFNNDIVDDRVYIDYQIKRLDFYR